MACAQRPTMLERMMLLDRRASSSGIHGVQPRYPCPHGLLVILILSPELADQDGFVPASGECRLGVLAGHGGRTTRLTVSA
jgi:hypothetical protein